MEKKLETCNKKLVIEQGLCNYSANYLVGSHLGQYWPWLTLISLLLAPMTEHYRTLQLQLALTHPLWFLFM